MSRISDAMKAYLHTLTQLVKKPGAFFSALDDPRRLPAVIFLAISSLLSALSAMVFGPPSVTLIQGLILMVNNFGMVILAVMVAYAVMVPLAGRGIGFNRLFGAFAYSSGVTLLFSWYPALILLTEPWRWWLTWTGMRRGCGLGRGQTALILSLSIVLIVMLFWLLLPLTAPSSAGAM